MKLIALEEHFVSPDVAAAWQALDSKWQDLAHKQPGGDDLKRRLGDLGQQRLAAMVRPASMFRSCRSPRPACRASSPMTPWRFN